MAFDIIKNIVEAEKQADDIKSKASEQIKALKGGVDSTVLEKFSNAKKEATAEEEKLVQKAKDDSKEKVDAILSKAKKECDEIFSKAKAKEEAAISAVIGKVVGSDG